MQTMSRRIHVQLWSIGYTSLRNWLHRWQPASSAVCRVVSRMLCYLRTFTLPSCSHLHFTLHFLAEEWWSYKKMYYYLFVMKKGKICYYIVHTKGLAEWRNFSKYLGSMFNKTLFILDVEVIGFFYIHLYLHLFN